MMTLRWTHWICGAKLSAPEEKSGARVLCPRCRQPARVPLTSEKRCEDRQRTRAQKLAEADNRTAVLHARFEANRSAIAHSAPECPLCRRSKMSLRTVTSTDNGRIFVAALVFLLFGGLWFLVLAIGTAALAIGTGSAAPIVIGGLAGTAALIYLLWKSTQVRRDVWACSSCGHQVDAAAISAATAPRIVVEPKVPPRPPALDVSR